MKAARISMVTIMAVIMAIVSGVAAQVARHDGREEPTPQSGIVELPGLGRVDVNQVPPEVRNNIRIPGVVKDEPRLGDLPPLAHPVADDRTAPAPGVRIPGEGHQLTVPDLPPPRNDAEIKEREELRQHLYPEDPAHKKAQAQDSEDASRAVPPDAFLKARQRLEEMRSRQPTRGTVPSSPQSLRDHVRDWVASAWRYLTSPAIAQAQQCPDATPWKQVGPAPYLLPNGYPNSGIVNYIAVDPSNSQRVYLGTRSGGLFQTANVTAADGPTWTRSPSLTNLSMDIEAITVDPNNSSVILAGTGPAYGGFHGTGLSEAVGTLRSTDGGTTWEQIGPTWCTTSDSPCRSGGTCLASQQTSCPGTDPAASTIKVNQLYVDPATLRVWEATSAGLWYSDNALSQSTSASDVLWFRVVALPAAADGFPEEINNVFVSQVHQTAYSDYQLYASIGKSNDNNNGWYTSTATADGGWLSWQPINTGLVSNPQIYKSSITQPTPDGDTLYSLVLDVPSPTCNGNKNRVYRTTNSGQTWTLMTPSDNVTCNCCISLQADPTNSLHVVAGGTGLFNSTDGWTSATPLGADILHADQNGLTFDPTVATNPPLFVGNDGGVWSISFTPTATCSIPPCYSFLHGNLANLEFFAGAVDTLDYGGSAGGTQDNGTLRGVGDSLKWSSIYGGDANKTIIDPKDSNTLYGMVWGQRPPLNSYPFKSIDGGATQSPRVSGFPPNVDIHSATLVIDPTDNHTLVAFSVSDSKVYRTRTAAEVPASGGTAWAPISPELDIPGISPKQFLPVISLAVAPVTTGNPSDLIFAGTHYEQVWRTTDAATWGPVGLASQAIGSFAFDTSQPCDAASCSLYATGSQQVFRSTDAGLTWADITGDLPGVPVNTVAVNPDDPNIIYVATDMGLYQGTCSGCLCPSPAENCTPDVQAWTYCPFMSGFPQLALVKDVAVHANAGLLRAFTFGNSAWETPAFPPRQPDKQVNTVSPVTNASSPRISTGTTGTQFAVAWIDDRNGANNWHVFLRGYKYDANDQPTELDTDFEVDDNSDHVAQAPALAAYLADTNINSPYCSRLAWQDDRLSRYVNQHIFFQLACSNGSKLYISDVRADTAATSVNATNAAIVNQPISGQVPPDFAIAWQQEHSAGSAQHDVYVRFFNFWGIPKTSPVLVNTSTGLDARAPALASDSDGNVFVAWEQSDASIQVAKYSTGGSLLAGPLRIDNQVASTVRHNVALRVDQDTSDNPGMVTAAWWDGYNNGPEKVVAARCGNGLSGCTALDGRCSPACRGGSTPKQPCGADADCAGGGQCTSRKCVEGPNANAPCVIDSDCPQSICEPYRVSCPSRLPIAGSQRALNPNVTSDAGGDFVICWSGNPNDPTQLLFNGMARSFSSAGAVLKNDFRVDLGGGTYAATPSVAQAAQEGQYVFAWHDNRSGHFDVYVRKLPGS